jgi:hypothetical protein
MISALHNAPSKDVEIVNEVNILCLPRLLIRARFIKGLRTILDLSFSWQ